MKAIGSHILQNASEGQLTCFKGQYPGRDRELTEHDELPQWKGIGVFLALSMFIRHVVVARGMVSGLEEEA